VAGCSEQSTETSGSIKHREFDFDILMTVRLSIILATDQLNAQIVVL
jgi:hypothetical protein